MAERGGQPGNSNAAKGAEWRQALKRALTRASKKDMRAGLDKVADMVVQQAMDGQKDAWQEIANRMDGKHAQSLAVSGDPENPLNHILETVIRDERG